MDLAKLKALKESLKITELKILCTGEVLVDHRNLLELQLLEDGRNLKQTGDEELLKLAESLLRFGIVNNLQVWFDENKNCYCFDAHHRKKALELLAQINVQIPSLPATRCLAETKIEAKKLLLLKESRSSWVDVTVVPDYIKEIGFEFTVAESVISLPEFSWGDVVDEEAGEVDDSKDDDVPEMPAQIVIKEGDLIKLGDHRLLCGDSTKVKDVKKLMGVKKCDLVFTDPPYGVSYADKNKFLNELDNGNRIQENIKNDHMTVEETGELWANVFQVWASFHADYSSFYICAPQGTLSAVLIDVLNQNKHLFKHQLIWAKNNHVLGRSDYNYKHESILYGWQHKHKFYGEGEQKTSLWEYDKNLVNDLHPTMKPVALMQNALLNSSEKGMIVADYFLGSGSTLIAAEKTGRKCFGMEIDPHYCQVIVQRWCDYTERDDATINGKKLSWSEFVANKGK
jgi:DNA modification methylase